MLTRVNSLKELREAIKETKPGQVILVADGVYDLDKNLEFKRMKGTEEKPVTVRAENLLKAEFKGPYVVKIRDSEHFVLEGFRFSLKADAGGKNGALSVGGVRHCRITRNHFELDETATGDDNQTWVTVNGFNSGHNRIDHNRFFNKTKKGHYIFISGEGDYVSQHDLIDHNHFMNRAYGNDENEYETIRGGESHIGNRDGGAHLIIRNNLFERCDGEDEIISFKVGDCSFLENTVINSHGSVVFRCGNRGVFAGNFFFNTYEERPFKNYRSGGVRFYGSNHRAYNNYFEGLDGTSAKAPLNLMHGAPAGSGALGGADGLPSTDCEIVHNTWVNCAKLQIGYESDKRPLKPERCTFANNIICETQDDALMELYEAGGVRFSGNVIFATHGKETGIENLTFCEQEFKVADPKLKPNNGIFSLTQASTAAIDIPGNTYHFVIADIQGTTRDKKPDAGAQEYTTQPPPPNIPLTPNKVGPFAAE